MAKWHSPNADIQFTMSDTKPILDKLGTLTDKLQKKGAKAAARKGMLVVRDAARVNAARVDRDSTPATDFEKNVAVQYSPRQGKRVGGVVYRVGLLGGARQYSTTKENVRKGRASLYDKSKNKWYKTLGSSGNPGGDTWYWRFVEFGTERARAHPFLQKALSENVDKVETVTVGELKVQLDKLAGTK